MAEEQEEESSELTDEEAEELNRQFDNLRIWN